MISWEVLHHSGHPFRSCPVQVAIHDIITGTSPLWEGPHSSLVQGVLQYNICLNSLDHRPPFSSRLTQHRLSHTHKETLSNTKHHTTANTYFRHFIKISSPLTQTHTHTNSSNCIRTMEASTKPSTPTSPPATTTTTPTRRPSRFTEDIFGHDLTRITSHDYDCALGIEGGNCEVLPAFPASPPNSYPPLPSSILISGSSHSSETNQKNSTSRSRALTQRPRTPGT